MFGNCKKRLIFGAVFLRRIRAREMLIWFWRVQCNIELRPLRIVLVLFVRLFLKMVLALFPVIGQSDRFVTSSAFVIQSITSKEL